MTYKILLVDNNQPFLKAVRHLLDAIQDLEIVGEASDGVDGLQKAKELQPDLILLDIAMPKMSGLDVALRIQSWTIAPKILFLTMYDDASYLEAARDLGAIGVLGKIDLMAELLPMIRLLIADQHSAAFPTHS